MQYKNFSCIAVVLHLCGPLKAGGHGIFQSMPSSVKLSLTDPRADFMLVNKPSAIRFTSWSVMHGSTSTEQRRMSLFTGTRRWQNLSFGLRNWMLHIKGSRPRAASGWVASTSLSSLSSSPTVREEFLPVLIVAVLTNWVSRVALTTVRKVICNAVACIAHTTSHINRHCSQWLKWKSNPWQRFQFSFSSVSDWGRQSAPPKGLDRSTGPSAIPRKFRATTGY